jgi:hypothetical protein
MANYEIRIQTSDGQHRLAWDVEQADDISALSSALELCETRKVELWRGQRHVASISLTGQPRLAL